MVGEMQTHQCYGDTVAQKHERLGRIRGAIVFLSSFRQCLRNLIGNTAYSERKRNRWLLARGQL